jgi:RNA polymerase sigma factor (sigma-70 family)
MLVKRIPLPDDVESRDTDWPCTTEPTAAELAAIEAELLPTDDVIDWERLVVEALPTPELIALAQSGSCAAFDPLYRRFAGRVLANALRRVNGDRAVAEDIASEVWATALAEIGQWQGQDGGTEQDLLRWLFGMTRWRVVRYYAAWAQEQPVAAVQEEWDSLGAPVHTPESSDETDSPAKLAMLARLRAAMEKLCPLQRDVMRLRLEGLSTADIAVKTELTVQQVKSATSRAYAILRRAVGEPIEDIYAADRRRVRAAVELLPEAQREVMSLRLSGLRQMEIAEHLDLPRLKVGNLWWAAEQSLRRRLAEPTANRLTVLPGGAARETATSGSTRPALARAA